MFEFDYHVKLSIVHPSVDPSIITQEIRTLKPHIASMAGTEKRDRHGRPMGRKIALSHWCASLHGAERLHSGDRPLSEFLAEKLAELAPYQGLLAKLRAEGEVMFVIDWFSSRMHTAARLDAEVLRRCGKLGIDIELGYYGPDIGDS